MSRYYINTVYMSKLFMVLSAWGHGQTFSQLRPIEKVHCKSYPLFPATSAPLMRKKVSASNLQSHLRISTHTYLFSCLLFISRVCPPIRCDGLLWSTDNHATIAPRSSNSLCSEVLVFEMRRNPSQSEIHPRTGTTRSRAPIY